MNFNQQEYLHILWLLLPLIFLYLYSSRRGRHFGGGKEKSGTVLDESLMLLVGRRGWKRAAFTVGFIFLIVALAGPKWGLKESIVKRKGIDIVVALDLSRSMLAQDISPSRIDRARFELSSFIDSRKGDRIGIVVFSGSAVVVCPLTMDYSAAKNFLKGLTVGMMPSLGTDITGALQVSADLMKGYVGREKALVLLTDGEDTTGDPVNAAKEAAESGVSIYTLGFGTKRGGPVPVYDKAGKIADYKKDKKGEVVISKLDGSLLRKIASEGKGKSFFGPDAVAQLADELERKDKSLISSKRYIMMEERFQLPLFVAFLFFSLEMLIRERRGP